MYKDSHRNSRHWDKELEGGLPDCRLSGTDRSSKTVMLGSLHYEKVFCADCGLYGGLVTADWAPHVFYLCEPCARKEQNRIKLAGYLEVPDEAARPCLTP